MIGKGSNMKSMAYVGNVVEFIKHRIHKKERGLNIFNYTDPPDMTMNQLISHVEKKLEIKISKIRIPKFLGFMGGYLFDVISLILKEKLSISSVRIKKFCATTQFNSEKAHSDFKSPFSIKSGLNKTLQFEFIEVSKDEVLFYSE